MLEIVNKIEELYGLLTKRLKEVENLKANLVGETAKLDGRETSISTKEADVFKRESKIGKIENVKSIMTECDYKVNSAAKELEDIMAKKRAGLDAIEADKVKLTDLDRSVRSNIDGLKVREAKLKVDRDDLEKEKLNYKNGIIKLFDKR